MIATPEAQLALCARLGAAFVPPEEGLKVGIARQTMGQLPVYGLRHPPEGGGTGWFIWAGKADFPSDADFFQPVCVECVGNHCPEVLPYLGLPPGYGFVLDGKGYEDVWYDEKLLLDVA